MAVDNSLLEYNLVLAKPDTAAHQMKVEILEAGRNVKIQCASGETDDYTDIVVMHGNKPAGQPNFKVSKSKNLAEIEISSFESKHAGTYECFAVTSSEDAEKPPMKRALLKLTMRNKNSALPLGFTPCTGDLKTSYCHNGGICFTVPPINSSHCYCANTGFSSERCDEPYIPVVPTPVCKYKPELMLSLPVLNVALALILAILVVLKLIERFRGTGRGVNSLPSSPATPFFPVYVCSQCQSEFKKVPPSAAARNGFLPHAISYDETATTTAAPSLKGRGMSNVSTAISEGQTEGLLHGSNGSSFSGETDGSLDTLQRQFKRSRKLAISETHLDEAVTPPIKPSYLPI